MARWLLQVQLFICLISRYAASSLLLLLVVLFLVAVLPSAIPQTIGLANPAFQEAQRFRPNVVRIQARYEGSSADDSAVNGFGIA